MTIKGKSREEYGNQKIDREGVEQAVRTAKQYESNQLSGVKNGVTKLVGDGNGGIVYENPYLLNEVTVSAPDMRIAKAARDRPDYKGLSSFAVTAPMGIGALISNAGGAAVDAVVRGVSDYNSWGEMVGAKTGLADYANRIRGENPFRASLINVGINATNPGYLLGYVIGAEGIPGGAVGSGVNNRAGMTVNNRANIVKNAARQLNMPLGRKVTIKRKMYANEQFPTKINLPVLRQYYYPYLSLLTEYPKTAVFRNAKFIPRLLDDNKIKDFYYYYANSDDKKEESDKFSSQDVSWNSTCRLYK
jgi:hypothetical protein